ncbi:MAG: response regulator [Rariglobus sp.]|jgi:CheY-like chemotaxis protein|nr:response regulator [Rariglobus sp.]
MPKPILLVEDNPDDVALALRAFAQTPLANEVVTVGDGKHALDYLLRQGAYAKRSIGNPSVVLLDLTLPGLEGLELLKHIKNDPVLQSIPVVVLTASQRKDDLARAYKFKANAYVIKPGDLTGFVNAVRELGIFWAVFNEPPPGSRRVTGRSSPTGKPA